MLFRSLLLTSTAALRTAALLVIPNGDAVVRHDNLLGAFVAYSEKVNLRCTRCPFRRTDEDGITRLTDDVQTSIEPLTFSVDHEALLVNNRQIFPPSPQDVITVQYRVDDGTASDPVPLGYEAIQTLISVDDSGLELFSVQFTVINIDGHAVPLKSVLMSLVRDGSNKYYIASVEVEESSQERVPWEQHRSELTRLSEHLTDRMRTLFESAKSQIAGTLSKCHRKHSSRPDDNNLSALPLGHLGRMSSGHAGGRRYHTRHGWNRTASRAVRFVLIPATLGVLAGLAASAIGIVLGQIIVSLWMRFRRSSSRQTDSHFEEGTESEKENLTAMATDDLLSAYTDDSREESILEKN